MSKQTIALLGAGKIGATIAKLLFHSGDYIVRVADSSEAALALLENQISVETQVLDISDIEALKEFLKDCRAVISALTYRHNAQVAQVALELGLSYFDLTEDVETTRSVRKTAARAQEGQIFMPQCGLAPGFIGILAHELCQGFDSLEKVKMRVGALPQYPTNMMMYNLTWSTDGLINEYCNPCEAIHQGKKIDVLPLEGLEHFSLDGMDYEAFNTSGGLGTLCETLEGRVQYLNYKTVRYEGHCYLMTFLTQSLRLGERREILKDILENAVPITRQDVVLIFCTVSGWKDGKLVQVSDARKIYDSKLHGEHFSSIQLTTAAAICASVDVHFQGRLPGMGFVRQEEIKLKEFLDNRFGKHYIVPEVI